MKTFVCCLLFSCTSLLGWTQSENDETKFGEQIFLPSLEVGWVQNASDILGGGVIMKTSIELRSRNNNDVFLRINYDTYNAEYTFDNIGGTSNVLKGKVVFTDILAGLGYRFGGSKVRYFIMFEPGIKLYNYPVSSQEGNVIRLEEENRSIFTTRGSIGVEYYFNEKAALTLDLFQHQVWERRDFWLDRGDAYGFSIGVITALF